MTTYRVIAGHRVLDDRPYDPKAPVESLGRISAVIRDIEPFISPASGKLIHSRTDQRDDFKATNTVPYERMPNTPRGYRNPSFARKRGLPLLEE